jgi:hypothetical protein
MIKDVFSLKNKKQLIKLCLLLFPEYRSGTISKNEIIFWKKRFSLLQSKVRFSVVNLLLIQIPKQLSQNNWGSNGLYKSVYINTLKDIFKNKEITNSNLTEYLMWFKHELQKGVITNISTSLIDQYKIKFDLQSEKGVQKVTKVIKISIKEDLIDPTIIGLRTIHLRDFTKKFQTLAATIITATVFNMGTLFRNITNQINDFSDEVQVTRRVVCTQNYVPSLPNNTYILSMSSLANSYDSS